jgi:hypothetical protein
VKHHLLLQSVRVPSAYHASSFGYRDVSCLVDASRGQPLRRTAEQLGHVHAQF